MSTSTICRTRTCTTHGCSPAGSTRSSATSRASRPNATGRMTTSPRAASPTSASPYTCRRRSASRIPSRRRSGCRRSRTGWVTRTASSLSAISPNPTPRRSSSYTCAIPTCAVFVTLVAETIRVTRAGAPATSTCASTTSWRASTPLPRRMPRSRTWRWRSPTSSFRSTTRASRAGAMPSTSGTGSAS